MTTFWTRFMQEPDSIRSTGRLATQEHLTMAIGSWPASIIKTDMIALAAHYPSVRHDLQSAGLTVQQEEAYRTAVIHVGFTRAAGEMAGPITATSTLGKNLALRRTHDEEFKQLARTAMWTTQ